MAARWWSCRRSPAFSSPFTSRSSRLWRRDGAVADFRRVRSLPAVMVLEADDVVFAEIAAGLHLDDMQRDLARVLQAVRRAKRDIGRLVLGQHQLLVAAHDLCAGLADHPMLGATMVHLQ